MKTHQLFATLTLALSLSLAQANTATHSFIHASYSGGEPEVQVVVGEKKIWFIADETPLAELDIRIANAAGETVLQKKLSSKTADWSLDVQCLAKGRYTLHLGPSETVTFTK